MESDTELDFQKLNCQQNRKSKKSGGFQSMGLSQPVFKGIIKKGYKIPTPIQRKCIPVILEGRDVVAMARTGSGKTAAFLIPLFERLKTRSAKTGARALILSPTRELALQTFKFLKELGKFCGLRAALILGGSKMDDQFAALHENPDVIIATPGRFLHVVMEMELKLTFVEYVVFDEADRLFEMGFSEQLREILKRLPENRQTLLFSATLPGMLADFAKAGLTDPILIRLDVDAKLSEHLKLAFISCRSEDKIAILLHLLKHIISQKELTVIFAATRHHVEYLNMILSDAGINSTQLYSSLDQAARKINVMKFQTRQIPVMVVTDLAARGIDIPTLDNVINFNFPSKPKLFVHRVGRVARAGRSGVAYSIISPDEMAHVLDLHLFLGRSINYAAPNKKLDDWNGVFGTVPRNVIEEEEEQLLLWHEQKIELKNMKRVCINAYKQYLKSRSNPSSESVRRIKEDLNVVEIGVHPLFESFKIQSNATSQLLEQMKNYKPSSTIFEINATSKTPASAIMRNVRVKNAKVIQSYKQKVQEKLELNNSPSKNNKVHPSEEDEENLKNLFSEIVMMKTSNKVFHPKSKQKKLENQSKHKNKDKEFFVPYRPSSHYSEQGLEIDKNSFDQQAASAVLDLTGDDINIIKQQSKQLKWDRKKKKFISESGKESQKRKIKTESGTWISATYKSDLYKKWVQKNKIEESLNVESSDEENEEGGGNKRKRSVKYCPAKKFARMGSKNKINYKRELKTKEEIMKQRRRKQRVQFHQKRRQLQHARRKQSASKKRK